MKKTVLCLAAATMAVGQPAMAGGFGGGHSGSGSNNDQDGAVETNTDNSQHIEDSYDDNSEYYEDSFDDNSEYYEDSFDDNSDHFNADMRLNSSSRHTFSGDAVVAETTLAGMVTGVDVNFSMDEDSGEIDNHLTNTDNAFQNYSGMNALNQNTGVGASQNASVSIAVSAAEFSLD